MNHRIAAAVAVVALVGAATGCSGDDAAPTATPVLLTVPSGGSVGANGSTTSTSPSASNAGSSTSAGAPTTTRSPGSTAAVDTTPITAPATQPTGVPGGASDVAVCRDYARVVGTQSVLTIAGAFGGLDAIALARLELISAPVVVEAADSMGEQWPAELAAERPAVTAGVTGPIAARANGAVAAIAAAGIDDTGPLSTAWLDALAAYDPADPAVRVVGLPEATEDALAAAASAYAASTTRYDLDPSVLRTASTPLTSAYLFANCPELSYLIAGDAD